MMTESSAYLRNRQMQGSLDALCRQLVKVFYRDDLTNEEVAILITPIMDKIREAVK